PGPDVGGQAVRAVVGEGQGLVGVVELDDRDDRPEDLLAGAPGVVGEPGEDGRLDVVAVGQGRVGRRAAAHADRGALPAGQVEVAEDPVALAGGDQRADVRVGQAGAGPQGGDPLHQSVQEC